MDSYPNSLIELCKIIDLTFKNHSDEPVVKKMYFNSYLKGYSSKKFICTKIKSFGVFFTNKSKSRNHFLVNKTVFLIYYGQNVKKLNVKFSLHLFFPLKLKTCITNKFWLDEFDLWSSVIKDLFDKTQLHSPKY